MVFNKLYNGFCHQPVEFEDELNDNNELNNKYCEICKRKLIEPCNYYENGVLVGWWNYFKDKP